MQQKIDLQANAKHLRRCSMFEFVMLELRVRDLLSVMLGLSVDCKYHDPSWDLVELRHPTLLSETVAAMYQCQRRRGCLDQLGCAG